MCHLNHTGPSFLPTWEALESRTLMSTTYYVSPSGNNSNPGTSQTMPWQSISKVDAAAFSPGDTVLFKGGQQFVGTLTISRSGSPNHSVNYGSYGSGNATIQSPSASSYNSRALNLTNAHDITINNLNFTAGRSNGQTVYGMKLVNSGSSKLSDISINNINVSGFSAGGLFFDGTNSHAPAGFNAVTISNSSFHDNGGNGITFGTDLSSLTPTQTIHSNITITHSAAYNDGQSGFFIANTTNALVEYSIAHDDAAQSGTTGAMGFMAVMANEVTFSNNEAYNNIFDGVDGGGFDFDWDTTNSVMQYNYSHDNDGHGYQLDNPAINGVQYPNSGNVIRFNLSQDDGRTFSKSYAAIDLWSKITNSAVYNNTVYMTPRSKSDSSPPAALNIHPDGGAVASNISYTNNAIVTSQIAGNSHTVALLTTSGVSSASNIKLAGNEYWSSGGSFLISFEGKTYSSFSSWQNSSGQEKSGKTNVALNVNPQSLIPRNAVTAVPSTTTFQWQPVIPAPYPSLYMGTVGNGGGYTPA